MSKQAVLPPTPSPSPPIPSVIVSLENPAHPAPFHGDLLELESTKIPRVPSLFRDGDGTASEAGDTDRTPIAQRTRTRRHSFPNLTQLSVSSLILDHPASSTLLPLFDIATSPRATSPTASTGIAEANVDIGRRHPATGESGVIQGGTFGSMTASEGRSELEKLNPGVVDRNEFRTGTVKFFNSQKVSQRLYRTGCLLMISIVQGFGFIVDSNPEELGDDEGSFRNLSHSLRRLTTPCSVFVHYSAIAAVQPGNGTFRSLSEVRIFRSRPLLVHRH